MKNLNKIAFFINEHHVLSLATTDGKELSACSLFYSYIKEELAFIVASSDNTTHIQHIKKNNTIAGNILLETKSVSKIQGLQFRGEMSVLEDLELSNAYFNDFPHAKLMHPKLWKIKVNYFKMTDNRLGFGKKIIWPEVLA